MEKLLEVINREQNRIGDKCGMTILRLRDLSGISIKELKPMLNEMSKQGLIEIRRGINHKLVFAL